jgi:hypothetical protein
LLLNSRVKIPKIEGDEDDYQCVVKIKDWLKSSGRTFLQVFDNVEENSILEQI